MIYTAPQVLERTGITYRQLDYWCSQGWLGEHHKDAGSGNGRSFTLTDVIRLGYAAKLIKAGFTTPSAMRLSKRLTDEPLEAITLAAGLVQIRAAA